MPYLVKVARLFSMSQMDDPLEGMFQTARSPRVETLRVGDVCRFFEILAHIVPFVWLCLILFFSCLLGEMFQLVVFNWRRFDLQRLGKSPCMHFA